MTDPGAQSSTPGDGGGSILQIAGRPDGFPTSRGMLVMLVMFAPDGCVIVDLIWIGFRRRSTFALVVGFASAEAIWLREFTGIPSMIHHDSSCFLGWHPVLLIQLDIISDHFLPRITIPAQPTQRRLAVRYRTRAPVETKNPINLQ